jgi:hypothetical protein
MLQMDYLKIHTQEKINNIKNDVIKFGLSSD